MKNLIKINKKISNDNPGSFITILQYKFPCGDIILCNLENGCVVKTSDFVTTYTNEEMKEIYNYPMNPKN